MFLAFSDLPSPRPALGGQSKRAGMVGISLDRMGPVSCPARYGDRKPMSCASIPKTFGKRVADALMRRLQPHGPIVRKQLCRDLRISGGTLDNWLAGNNAPSGERLVELMAYMDPYFSLEISDGRIAKLPDEQARQAARRFTEAGVDFLRAIGERH